MKNEKKGAGGVGSTDEVMDEAGGGVSAEPSEAVTTFGT